MNVHFIAIGGSAMHNLAIALSRKGFNVSGSDDEIFEPSLSRFEKQGILPEKIEWDADEKEKTGYSETKSISVSLWDSDQKNTLRIDLWAKDMPLDEMKRFYIDCLGGIGQTLLNATGDQFMSEEINGLCDKLVEHVKKEAE